MNFTKPSPSRTASVTQDLTRSAMGAALITVCSWIAIPTALPFTLQTLGVFLSVGLLGGRRGTVTVLVYLLLGAAGLPVFGGFVGGLGFLLGFTGGYLFGFLAAAMVIWLLESLWGDQKQTLAVGFLLGQLLCYVCGVGWYMLFYAPSSGLTLSAAIGFLVTPYLLPDLVKLLLALILTNRLRRYVS